MTESSELEFSEVHTKPAKEAPMLVVQEQGVFLHDTGDAYDGYFEAKKKDRSVKMHGPGVYTTSEGDIYCGTWEADRLGAGEQVVITYSDGSKYEGNFKEWSYSGMGSYCYADGSALQCDFVENCPAGSLTLTDPNGHRWLGQASPGFGWVRPMNHFYDILEKTAAKPGKPKRHRHKELAGTRTPLVEPTVSLKSSLKVPK